MDWIVLLTLGVIIGILAAFVTEPAGVPQLLSLSLAVAGVIVGGLLAKMTGFAPIGPASIYIMGAVLALALLAGGTLAYVLTTE